MPELYKRKHASYRITNHKKIFFNASKDVECFNCKMNLLNEYILSAPNGKYRCLECAIKIGLIDKVPPNIDKAMN